MTEGPAPLPDDLRIAVKRCNSQDAVQVLINEYKRKCERERKAAEREPTKMNRIPIPNELEHGVCTCSYHCKNNCELACCGEDAGWCLCWCHYREYRQRRNQSAGGQAEPVRTKEKIECP